MILQNWEMAILKFKTMWLLITWSEDQLFPDVI